MGQIVNMGRFGPRSRYLPRAKYYQLGDYVEYVREDKPYIMRRVDELLTLALDVDTRKVEGFRLKGFKNLYLRHVGQRSKLLDKDFLALVAFIETAATDAAHQIIDSEEAKRGYREAYQIAVRDQVVLTEVDIAA